MSTDNLIAKRADKSVHRDGDSAVKIFGESYSKSDILNEALNQARVEETGLPVPKIRQFGKTDGKWSISMDFIEGKTLDVLMHENPSKLDEYLVLFVDLQLEILSKQSPLLNNLTQKMHRKINETTLDATTRYELNYRLDSMPKHNKVCHGDFNPSNVIITPDNKAYVIDWSHATQGNASADAARTYLLFMLSGNKELADKYLHLFCKKSDTALQYVQKWLPIVAASQSVKGKPEEREFLLGWVDIVDYE
ncbi:MAG: aminoglycoside phosphotransferase family protein [Oscillospiraceae bacterium]